MKHCVVFAAFCPPTDVARRVSAVTIERLKAHHAESDIYIGFQPDADPDIQNAYVASGLKVRCCDVEQHLVIDSDASAFIAALALLRSSTERYDVIWFAHTKGASRETFEEYNYVRDNLDRNFWSRRSEAEAILRNPTIGVIGQHLIAAHHQEHLVSAERLHQLAKLPYRGLCFTIFQTHYVMSGRVVHAFLNSCEEKFFSSHLKHELGFSRFFFEDVFPAICGMGGEEPHVWDFDLRDPRNCSDDLNTDRTNRIQGHSVLASELARWRGNPRFQPKLYPVRARVVPASS